MKKFLLIFAILLITTTSLMAQSIKKNETDKFTGVELVETSVENLYSHNPMLSGYTHKFDFVIRRVNGSYVIVADILMNDIVKYTEDSGVVFLLDNSEIVSLKTSYTGIGGEAFANGYYFSTTFNLSAEDVAKMKEHKITDVRITYLGGYYDKSLKENKRNLIQKMLLLFD